MKRTPPSKLAELDTYTLRAKAQTMKLCNPAATVPQIAEALRAPTYLVRALLFPAEVTDPMGLSQYRYPAHEDDQAQPA